MRNSLPAHFREIVAIASIAFVLLGLAPVTVVRAQTTGTLRGQVFDAAGNPLPGVKVTITNVESENAVSVQTDDSGTYLRPFLFPGSYRITASRQGFIDGGVDARVPLNSTTVIQPPAITIRPAATTATATPPQPDQQQPKQQQPAPVKEPESSLLVNKVDPMRGGNFTGLQLWTLPLGAGNTMRSFDELAFLLPGVVPPPYTPGVRGPGVGFGIGTAGQFSVNGMRARSNNFTVDGSDNNDPDVGVRRQGFVALVPQSVESVQEFQIATLLWSAEFGRNMGSQVNAVSRAGSKAIHGQAYGFFTDSSLNARNAFNSSGRADPLTRSQVGFAIGGPIVRDRAQFFGSYEHVGVNSSVTQHFSSPTLAERRFTIPKFQVGGFNDNGDFESKPVTGGVTPLGQKIFSLFPLPNDYGPFGNNTYSEVLPADGDASIASFRVTERITPNNTLTGRYNFTDDGRILPSVNQAIRSTIESKTRTQNLSIVLDSGISATLFNQGRFSYGRSRIKFPQFPTSPFLLPGNQESLGQIGEIVIEPFSPLGVDAFTFPQGRENETFQFADTLSYNYRNHSLKFGFDIRPIRLNSFQDRLYRPLVTFGEGLSPKNADLGLNSDGSIGIFSSDFDVLSGVQSAALGLPSSIQQTITAGKPDSNIRLRSTEYNFFFNDNWRARPNFTIDYGLRYEYNTVPREQDRRIENALRLQNLPTPGKSSFDKDFFTSAFNAAVTAYKQILDGRRGIYNVDKNNLGPHVGFAWSPTAERGIFATLLGKQNAAVIRGGYGIYYDTILGAVVSQSRNVFPTEIPLNVTPDFLPFGRNSLIRPANLFFSGIPLLLPGSNQFGLKPDDFVAAIGAVFSQSSNPFGNNSSGLAFTLPQKNLRTPYAQQWHLTFERQIANDYLVSAAYVGAKGTKLTRLTTPNGGPSLTTFVPVFATVGGQSLGDFPAVIDFLTGTLNAFNRVTTTPFPDLGAFQIFENTASSNYHAFQLEGRKRYSHGYQFTVAYTWSHAIDDVSDVFPISGAPVLAQGRNSGILATDDPANFIASERADANFDIRHRVVASLVWDLPFYRDSHAGAALWLGGWQVSSIFQAHTGQPFTINLPFDDNGDGNLSDRPVSAVGLVTSSGHGSSRVTVVPSIKTLTDINDSFGEKAVINQVRIPRNSFRGDGFRNLDLALGKRFRFKENQSLDFRTEMFNSMNRANYGLPVRTLSAPGFGSSFDTVNPARLVQFALKYSF